MRGSTAAQEPYVRAHISEEDFAALYRDRLHHLSGLFRAKGVGAEEAGDLAQETMLRTLQHLKRHGRTQEDLGPLTRTIARNLLVERLRRAAPATVSLSDEIDAVDDAPDPSELALQSERRGAVRGALGSLTPRHRRVIELWMQGLTPADIARELGIKRNAADALLHRARRTLASRLGPRALWGAVVLAWLRVKSGTRSVAQTLASWSPDSAALGPAAVSLATVGIVAAISLGDTPSVGVADRPLSDTSPVAATHRVAQGSIHSGIDAGAKVPLLAASTETQPAPTYEMQVGAPVPNPATDDDESLLDVKYDPDSDGGLPVFDGRSPIDDAIEPVFQACTDSEGCKENR